MRVGFKVVGASAVLADFDAMLDMPEYREHFEHETSKLFDEIVEATPIYKNRMQPNWQKEYLDDGYTCEIANRGLSWPGLVAIEGTEKFVSSIARGTDMSGRPYLHPKIDGDKGILEDVEGMTDEWKTQFLDGLSE